uniref:Uncharacterized protein n=2 Tax=Vibrio ziniensis TaxID=2711221 RepID=A0A6G7CME9_9VIBR|nr:hypothetical protein G5S32_14300 [Vibrio ziniensis]
MKVLITPIAILAIGLLPACSTTSSAPQSQLNSVKASLDQPLSIKPQTFMVRGEVVIGNDTRTFTPCGSNQQFLLEMPASLAQQAMKVSNSPYQAMYGELIGHLTIPSHSSDKSDYSAKFVVENINIISAENPKRCQQPSAPTSAFGIEPHWTVKLGTDTLTFQSLGEKPQVTAIKVSDITPSTRHYEFKGGELTLERQICTDGMSDSVYGWASKLTLAKRSYKGCATLGNSDPTLAWAGDYFASSTQNTGFSVTLTLDNDHTATTQYTYSNGDPAIVEKGYWQQLSQTQVQVVMTRHQQQYLVSERIFTKQDQQLIAEKERVGNVVYPIANGGLVLFSASNKLQ